MSDPTRLSAAMVAGKRFRVVKNGFDVDEVLRYLDRVAVSMRALEREAAERAAGSPAPAGDHQQ